MGLYLRICIWISLGTVIGFLAGIIKSGFRKTYTEKQIRETRKWIDRMSFVLKYITMLMLVLGLVWCTYFLVLGALVPERSDYANNMSELIVSVLTVISIIFAFFEFVRRAGNKQ